jgi:hypothetical protein
MPLRPCTAQQQCQHQTATVQLGVRSGSSAKPTVECFLLPGNDPCVVHWLRLSKNSMNREPTFRNGSSSRLASTRCTRTCTRTLISP